MTFKIKLGNAGQTIECQPDRTILVAAVTAGIDYPYPCATGNCATCISQLESGEVDLLPHGHGALSRRFGALDWAPVQETGRRFGEGKPELYVVSNVLENGVPIGSLGSGEAVWHTDMSYLEDPPKASMLYALEVPPSGGNTGFVNMYAAYEALPPALKQRVAPLRVKHDGTYNS